MFQSSFSLFYCYYLLIIFQSALERAFFKTLEVFLVSAHKNNVIHFDGLVSLFLTETVLWLAAAITTTDGNNGKEGL